jgi:hypothetical protein
MHPATKVNIRLKRLNNVKPRFSNITYVSGYAPIRFAYALAGTDLYLKTVREKYRLPETTSYAKIVKYGIDRRRATDDTVVGGTRII